MNGTVIVYGGSGGIGSAVCRSLTNKGAAVHLVGRTAESLASIAAECNGSYTVGDVLDPELFGRVMDNCKGDLAGVVYGVGTINLGSLRRLQTEDFLNDFKVNAMGAALAVQAAATRLKKNKAGATVVFYSSVAALQGFTFHSSIGMAKAAINGLTLSLAAELSPHIRVNAIAPSLVETELAAPLLANEKTATAIKQSHALKRLGSPSDIAELTTYLLSPEASWITGQIISVDGGRSALRTVG